jgi:hypothetical protein
VKLPDNFQMREHSWPCRFHIIAEILLKVPQKVSRYFGPTYIGDDLFLGPNLVSFNRAVGPLLELSFLTKSQKLTSA